MFHTSISKVLIVAFLFLLIFAIKLIIKIVTWNVLLDIMIINTGTSVFVPDFQGDSWNDFNSTRLLLLKY